MRVVGLMSLLVLLAAAPARAGTAGAVYSTDTLGQTYLSAMAFVAAPGERNAVTVTADENAVRVSDAGAAVTAGPGCTAEGASARCVIVSDHYTEVQLALGDGDDTAVLGAIPETARIDGGDGNDTLTARSSSSLVGGAGDDVITGSEYRDSIDPGAGADTVRGRGGEDHLYADTDLPPVADRYDGGDGQDLISYLNRRTGVRVDLAADVGGEPGERDVVARIEDVIGSVGADVLLGDDARNRFYTRGSRAGDRFVARGGNDRIEGSSHADAIDGGAGDDHISGYGGADRIDGGPGRDKVDVRFLGRGGRPSVTCDSGRDEVALIDPAPTVLRGCRRVLADRVLLRLRRRAFTARSVGRSSAPCRLRVTFTRDGEVLARVRAGRPRGTLVHAPVGRVTVSLATARCGRDFTRAIRFIARFS